MGGTWNELRTHSCIMGRFDSCHLPLGSWDRRKGKPRLLWFMWSPCKCRGAAPGCAASGEEGLFRPTEKKGFTKKCVSFNTSPATCVFLLGYVLPELLQSHVAPLLLSSSAILLWDVLARPDTGLLGRRNGPFGGVLSDFLLLSDWSHRQF